MQKLHRDSREISKIVVNLVKSYRGDHDGMSRVLLFQVLVMNRNFLACDAVLCDGQLDLLYL